MRIPKKKLWNYMDLPPLKEKNPYEFEINLI